MTTEILGVVLAFFSSVAGAFGAIFLKKGMDKLKLNLKSLMKNYALMFGVLAYIAGVLFFMFALKKGELSILYPFLAITYIWVSLLSVRMLDEKMNRKKWMGILVILIGVILIGVGA